MHTPIGAEFDATAPMDADTVLAVLSITKPVATVAVLQLVEDGLLDLDAPAARYLPVLGEMQVIDGYDADGAPQLRPPRREITTRMLLLHTAGFAYSNFNHDLKRLEDGGHLPYIGASTKAALMSHLVADPGQAWEYGLGMDWAGQVVEAITGARLGEIMTERIFTPLGMDSTAFTRTEAMTSRLSAIHARLPDSTLMPIDFTLPLNPEVEMAGHGLYSTASDFTRFLRMWLNEGQGPSGKVLRADTIAEASRNGLGALRVRPLPAANTDVVGAPLDFFPGTSRSWALGSMVNDEQVHTGRSAGSLSWGGLANSFYWIDPAGGSPASGAPRSCHSSTPPAQPRSWTSRPRSTTASPHPHHPPPRSRRGERTACQSGDQGRAYRTAKEPKPDRWSSPGERPPGDP